ncbi:glycoside hydrolase family 97 protein [Ferruginibacter lapsinanis]|uniref:glycoside hydrolase family 97 protein n=1 Tax=Ferruginibacter lapsinanis TaxID=563172 RepID=UPI001E599BBF|nr:glycoside hydrolase family 97 protein [Ferruginibacter lapsinanis]UEG49084.1 glycoside hydrolase family 97 protein [Ferruginibacter lapsinanis]
MNIKKYFGLSLLLLLINTAMAQSGYTTILQKVKLVFSIDDKGVPTYQVFYGADNFIKSSRLGLKLADNKSMDAGLTLIGVDSSSFDETWTPVLGEVNKIRNRYKQFTAYLKHNATGNLVNIVFRVFEDGIGFRYEFPKQAGLKYFVVTDELTQFNLAGDHKTFWIPGDYDANEYAYTESKMSQIGKASYLEKKAELGVYQVKDFASVQTPLMMKSDKGLYINIHEAALIDYPAMQLHVDTKTFQLSADLAPDVFGNKAHLLAPFHTPWRTIIVSDKAADILMSKTILNLNEPSKMINTSWIKPMKFVGVWWKMQTGNGTWSYTDYPDSTDTNGKLIPNGRHCANTANVKRYIDFASANGIQGVLVEGWNTGWESCCSNWTEDGFDFVTPYPDFNVRELHEYAAGKGVQMIMHNETGSSVTNYERQIDTAFKFMNAFGYTSVKTGYVGKIIPRGEYHDGQWMVNHYLRTVEKAAQYNVMIDIHEPMRPTGLQRTYPNWLANEAARGNEYYAFGKGNPIDHETILPFTRLMGGPMDYTPGIFKLNHYAADTTRKFRSTLCKQLALYVTMYSPLQMAADLPENYETHKDAFKFISDVPVDWDDTKVIAAEPGDYIAIARKGKGTNNWFIGAITDENNRDIKVDLSFLDKNKKYAAIIYADAPGTDWQHDQEKYSINKMILTVKSTLTLHLAKGGGAAVSIIQL